MTVSAPAALDRLTQVARLAGAQNILAKLRAVALSPDVRDFAGMLVSYLAQRERLGILANWSADEPVAAELVALGRAAWADAGLLGQLRPIGDEHLAKRQIHGYLSSHYLAAMAATRRARSRQTESEPFVERLRLLLLLRALEAAEEGIPRETNLAEVCLTVRQVSDETDHDKWRWLHRIAHPTSGLDDFIGETRFQVQKTLGEAKLSQPELGFYRSLRAVLDRDFKAASKGDHEFGVAQAPEMPRARLSIPRIPVLDPAVEAIDHPIHIAEDNDESRAFAIVEVDPDRPPVAQRDQGNGLILQSLEDSQYLRHSWHRLNRAEEEAFLNQAQRLMQDDHSMVDRVGAALTMVAMLTSRPLSGLESMTIQASPDDDWSLDLRDGALHRRPPRFPRRWRAGEERASQWIRPLAADWRIALSAAVKSALASGVGKGARCTSVGDLWARVSHGEPLHLWFGRRLASLDALERLTAPVVSTVAAQAVFEHAGDHAHARLASSSSRSGLPSACTYGSFSAQEIRGGLGNAIAPELGVIVAPAASSEDNAAGSELDVDLGRMAKVIARMVVNVDETARRPGEWADHHNRLTALCVVALLASTGARPVNSPFESLDWIDLERRILYVEDKHSGPTRGARLCVLSEYARELLVDHYLPHLKALPAALRGSAKGMADEIEKVASGQPECRLPLFFLLRAEPTLDWIEVSESQLTGVCKDPWPLPWNVFRHLHSTQLRRWGLNPEIRDALLSHGDRGAESHGEFSWRVPQDDLERARPLVNRLVEELGFRLPSKAPGASAIGGLRAPGPDFATSTPFGRKARTLRRQSNHEAARRTAKFDIDRLVRGRPPVSLSEQAWDDVARAMLLRPDGLPHAMASLRYEVLEDYLAQLWRDSGAQARRPAVRHIPVREAVSVFDEDVIQAQVQLDGFRRRFDEALEADGVLTPRRPVLAACLAALELTLHCRVGHFAVLAGVACNSAAVKVVHFQDRYWIEWAYRGDWRDGRPNYRVPVTERAAGWIAQAQDAKKRATQVPETPQALFDLLGSQPGDFGRRLSELASLTRQANYLALPGAVAAVLNGDLQSAALPHHDWIRTTELAAPAAHLDASGDRPAQVDAVEHFFRNHQRAVSAVEGNALQRCRTLFDAIQKILSMDKAAESQDGRRVLVTPERRAADIARAVHASGFAQGDAPYVMAHYALHLLKRRKQAGPAGAIKASTALRYWESLKPGFLDFAYDLNLPDLEEDELTELYEKIVSANGASADGQLLDSTPGHARRRKLMEDSDAGQRALSELVGFHDFARELYGLEDPDWNEIAPGNAVGHGRPGIVLLGEYKAALGALIPADRVEVLDDDTLAAAFVLFACARFGLRGGEAVGLQRRDWVELAGSIVVLVRSSHLRALKNIRSKRQVPLVGELVDLERALVDETLRRWEHREGVNRNSPLLPGVVAKGFKLQQRCISARLLPLIKAITGNPADTVHHLRHGYACRLLSLVCGISMGKAMQDSQAQVRDARKLLMSSTEAGRRTLWAVARMLGHASPSTTLKAYAHVMDAWVPQPGPRSSTVDLGRSRHILHLDALERDVSYLARMHVIAAPATESASLWVRFLQYLRLRALGNANAAWSARLDKPQVDRLEAALNQAASRLKVFPINKRNARELLAAVRTVRWNELIEIATSAGPPIGIQPSNEWLGTIGANRQIVLFSQETFQRAGQFVKALSLTPTDCKLVFGADLPPKMQAYAATAGLTTYAVEQSRFAPTFQIDRAVVETPEEHIYKNRMALVPARSGRLADTNELVILWTTWLCWCTTNDAI